MSAANFCTMKDFPLFAKDYYDAAKRCPKCGAIMDENAKECDFCDCKELEDYNYFDQFTADEEWDEIANKLAELNQDLLFHKVELRSGYYTGIQFYVEVEHDLSAEDYSNDDCHYYFDCCRSVAYRKYAAEVKKINRKLAQFGKQYGFQEYVCTARFSNGEAWYELASNPRARLKAAIA